MKNKVLVELCVPELEESYDIYIPVDKKIGTVIKLLNKAVFEISDGVYTGSDKSFIYSKENGSRYDVNLLVKETDIRNGTKIILI